MVIAPVQTVSADQKKSNWPWMCVLGAIFFGILALALILPSTGFISERPPPYLQSMRGILHYGPFYFYPETFFYIGCVLAAWGSIAIGAVLRSKFELMGWILLGSLILMMIVCS
jgi:hypothetical protein